MFGEISPWVWVAIVYGCGLYFVFAFFYGAYKHDREDRERGDNDID